MNFLVFSGEEWKSSAGKRYVCHNGLSVGEWRELFEGAGYRIFRWEAGIDPEGLRLVRNGELSLDQRFQGKSPEPNATKNVWALAA